MKAPLSGKPSRDKLDYLEANGGSFSHLRTDTTHLQVLIEFIQRCGQPLEPTITSNDIQMN